MDNRIELIREARTNGETYLTTQIALAVAADQRAISLGGILAAAASVLLGFAISSEETTPQTYIFVALAGALSIACGSAFMAARPVKIRPPGNTPANWLEDIEENLPLVDVLREDLNVIQRSIEINSHVIDSNRRWLTASMVLATGSVFVAVLAWFAIEFGFWGAAGVPVPLP